MRIYSLLSIAVLLGACGGRQTPTTGLGYAAGQVKTTSASTTGRPRAVCTPYVSLAGDMPVVRTVCEVDDKLYQAFSKPKPRQKRRAAHSHLVGFPDDGATQSRISELDLEAVDIEALAQSAADDVDNKLEASDPIAGIGDPAAAWRAIEALPMSVMLATFDILAARGRLDSLVAYRSTELHHHERTRVDIALYIRGLNYANSAGDVSAVLHQTAEKIAYLEVRERHDFYRYLMTKQQISREMETLLEGFMALEFAQVTWKKPVVAPGLTVGSATPDPIEPGPWLKPPDEPAELYIGKEAHREIAHHYRMINWSDKVFVNHRPIYIILQALRNAGIDTKSGTSLTVKEGSLRPDIVNISKMYIYEIKPSSQLAAAGARAAMYLGILGKAGVSMALGPPGAPGTSGVVPAPGGVFMFTSPAPGVIVYDYRRGSLVPVKVPQTQENESPSWTWELQPQKKAEPDRLLVVTIVTMAAILAALATAPFSG